MLHRARALALLLLAAGLPAAPLEAAIVPLRPPPVGDRQLPPRAAEAAAALARGDHARATTLARELLREDPRAPLAHELLGAAAYARGDLVEARRALEEAQRLDPRRPSVVLRLAHLALDTRDFKAAEAGFRKALELAPRDTLARPGLAMALLGQGRRTEALAEAREALRRAPASDPQPRYVLAAIQYELRYPAEADAVLTELLAAHPDFQPGLLLAGLVKLELRQFDEAAALLDRASARDPRSALARLGRAVVLRTRGDLAGARTLLEELTREHPDSTLAHLEHGDTLLALGQLDAALRAFDAAERAAGAADLTRLRVAELLLLRGHPEPAIARARAAMTSPAATPLARLVIVQARLRQGQREEAERELAAAVTAAGRDAALTFQLGRFYLAIDRPRDALAQFKRAATLRPGAPEPLVAQVDVLLVLRRPAEALAIAEQVVKSQKESAGAQVYLGRVRERAGQPASAEAAYRAALARQPGHLGAMTALAVLVDGLGRHAEGVKLLEEAAAAHATDAQPLADLGQIEHRAGNVPAAIAAYRRALARDPDHALALNNLAFELARDVRQREEARALAERAWRRAPWNPGVADTLGWVLYLRGEDLPRAEKLLTGAAAALPGNAHVRFHLGMVYARQGRRDEARRELTAALQTPDFPEAAEARRTLDGLR